tara:strand:- start:55586 stop:56305 length:720 start_codon:yes stop_codon:yes gene_type:complete
MTIVIAILVLLLVAFIIAFIHADDKNDKLRGEAESGRILANAKIKQVVYWRDNAIKLEKRLIRCNRRIATQNAHTSNLEDDTQRLACELNARESLEDELAEADRQIQDFDARFKRQQETIKGYQSNTAKLNDEIDRMTQSNSDLLEIIERGQQQLSERNVRIGEKTVEIDDLQSAAKENYRLLGNAKGTISDLERRIEQLTEELRETRENSNDRDALRLNLAKAQSKLKRIRDVATFTL